jgi:TonB family protein
MAKILITLVFISFVYSAFAQSDADSVVYFFKNDGSLARQRESADYIIAIFPPDKKIDKHLFIVKGYYPDNKVLFTATSTSKTELMLQGKYVGYFHNGNKLVEKTYDGERLVGDVNNYYPNGKLYTITSYNENKKLLLNECRDSTGAVLAKDGNGKWIQFDDDFKVVKDYGRVVNGLMDGDWHRLKTLPDTAYDVITSYRKGILISSTGVDAKKTFHAIEVSPEFPGGLDAFYKYINRSIHYPEAARRHGTQGRVIVSFVVQTDGSLTDIKVARGIGDGCDEVALQIIKSSPKWKPGMQNGVPVRVNYSVPITFSLQ